MNAIQALISTYVAGAGAAQSGFFTFTFIITREIEAWIPILITNPNTANISTGAEVTVFRSTDLGLTWENVGTLARVFPRPTAAAQVQRRDVYVSTGWYLISVQVGGGVASTWSVNAGTAWVITAYA